MCRACFKENITVDEFVLEVIPAYFEAKEAIKKYEQVLLKYNIDVEHKKVVSMRRKFNKSFSEFKIGDR